MALGLVLGSYTARCVAISGYYMNGLVGIPTVRGGVRLSESDELAAIGLASASLTLGVRDSEHPA